MQAQRQVQALMDLNDIRSWGTQTGVGHGEGEKGCRARDDRGLFLRFRASVGTYAQTMWNADS